MTENKYSVSVIIPVYNAENYICRCASSLFNQTLDSIQYIFVDDCSTDSSVLLLENTINEYPNRKGDVIIITQKTNQGPSCARNKGLEMACGEYVIYCDADDWVDREMYDKMYSMASLNGLDLVWCDFKRHFGTHDGYIRTIDYNESNVKRLKSFLAYGWSVCVNILAKRSLYEDNNLCWCEDAYYNEDFDLAVRLFYYALEVGKIEEPLYHYDAINQNSIVHWELDDKKRIKIAKSELLICDRIISFFKEIGLYTELKQELSWRVLKAKRHLLDSKEDRYKYLKLYPESDQYIDSNPFCSKKDKLYQKLMLKPIISWTIPILRFIERGIVKILH